MLRTMIATTSLPFAFAGCNILDVSNPNNVVEDALTQPSAATPIANGVNGSVVRALAALWGPYHTVTDELDFVGSQDGFFQLDVGNVSNPIIQFVDQSFPDIAEARWLGDEAIGRLEAFDSASALANRNDLANVYLNTALAYVTIADMFDDFAFSNRTEPAAPIGETNMAQVYDTAVAYLDRGLAIATATQNAGIRTQILAMRARAKYSRGLWAKINPPERYPEPKPAPLFPVADPYVNDAGAVADAQAALALMGAADYTWKLTPTINGVGGPNVGNDLNQRREMRIGDEYAVPDPGAIGRNRTQVVEGQPVIALIDPVSGQPDAALRGFVRELITANPPQLLPMTLVSAREMHLIVAEAALAAGDLPGFVAGINRVRAFTPGLPPYDGVTPAPLEMLRHARRTNLFMQGRRLQDMARFGERDDRWQPSSAAYVNRGCFFPITEVERQSNPLVTERPVCEGL